ncbi:MAG: OmpA family protein [Acidobacteria bacterium]|nr:OmpA family protein [Acidobacteriota bacterium]
MGNEKFVALTVRTEKQAVSKDAPDQYQELTRGAERLSLNFRFKAGKKELDNKALGDIDLIVEILAKNKSGGQKVLLMGFTDNTGGSDRNVQLSKERAETVAEEFRQRGVTPSVIMGFGAQMPVASNDNKEGQEKNRRVEIWLKQ